jgi:hypothetical protein
VATSNHSAPRPAVQGETNLDLLHQAFAPAAPVLSGITAQVDTLKAQQMVVEMETARLVAACAQARTRPMAVRQLIDTSRALTRQLAVALGRIDEGNENARELTDLALSGLRPAQQDLDTTWAQRASGDLYNRLGH